MNSERADFFIEVALGIPIAKLLSYRVPDELRSGTEVGKRVLVPLGKRKVTGYVVGSDAKPEGLRSRTLSRSWTTSRCLPPIISPFTGGSATTIFSPFGGVIKTALPASIDVTSRQVISLTEKGENLPPAGDDIPAGNVLKALREKKGISFKALQKRHFQYMLYTTTGVDVARADATPNAWIDETQVHTDNVSGRVYTPVPGSLTEWDTAPYPFSYTVYPDLSGLSGTVYITMGLVRYILDYLQSLDGITGGLLL